MNFRKIWVIVEKEFDEILKNKLILSTLLMMPIVFAVLVPLGMLLPVTLSPADLAGNDTMRMVGVVPGAEHMSVQEAYITFMVTAILPLFMVLPAILPTIISSYSIIGEKKNRTLEPLLAAPISVEDIMIGKTVSAMAPALVGTWLSAGIFSCLVWLLTHDIVHRLMVPDLTWLLGLFVLAPLLAFFGVLMTVVISSRVSDPRVAQQISVVLILPLMAVFIGQMMGLLLINPAILLVLCGVALVADVALVKIGSELFDREEILTRWR